MTTPAEALSSVTGQQQTAFERERVDEPERQDPGAAKTASGAQVSSAGDGQPVFGSLDELQERLARGDQAQAKLARQQEQARASQKRYRQRHLEQVRQRNAAYMREARARQREQGSSVAGQQQPVFDRLTEREGQWQGAQPAQVKPERRDQEALDKQERRRTQNAAAKRRYRERRGDEGKRQEIRYKREWRARKRREQQPVFDQVSELERLRAEARQEQARLDHQRELKAAAQRRRRQNLGDQGRAHHAEYMREWRARRRQQGSP